MDLVVFVIGIILVVWFGISFLNMWGGSDRDELLTNDNGTTVFHVVTVLVGLLFMASPLLFKDIVSPEVYFELSDTIMDDRPNVINESFIELDGKRLPIHISTAVPACEIEITRDYPYMTMRDEDVDIVIMGYRCSDIPSILDTPQVKAVLSGWKTRIDEIHIPANLNLEY